MKKQVVFGKLTLMLTILMLAIVIVSLVLSFNDTRVFVPLCGIFILILFASLWYCPLSIEIGEDGLFVNRALSLSKRFAFSDIASIRAYTPPTATIRLCGSGGFLGYWGWFSDRQIGKYFAYYGSKKDCFLVELKTGKKYLLGCKDSASIVEELSKRI